MLWHRFFLCKKKTVQPSGGTDLEPMAQFFTLSNVNNLALRQKNWQHKNKQMIHGVNLELPKIAIAV